MQRLLISVSILLLLGCQNTSNTGTNSKTQAGKTPVAAAAGDHAPPAGLSPMGSPHGQGTAMGAGQMHPTSSAAAPADMDFSGLKVPEGGTSIANLYKNRASLKGKGVKIQAKVVKVSPEIMGTNWIHIQDGTADGKNVDLTVTSHDLPKAGDTVVITGVLAVDKVVGMGMKYPVLLENGKVTAQ